MFYLTYIGRELSRRAGRTILTAMGLAIGVGLVIMITALSSGLDRAQTKILGPLATVGTDLVVARAIQTGPQTGGPQPPNKGFFIPSPEEQQTLNAESQALITDLSKLGNSGDRFVHDFFMPSNQLTFPADQVQAIATLPGVAAAAPGLTLLASHQEGTVPSIVAELKVEGQTININERIEGPSRAEMDQANACMSAAVQSGELPRLVKPVPPPNAGPDWRPAPPDPAVIAKYQEVSLRCMPERMKNFQKRITIPERTIRQVLKPPATDITSTSYTIAGVDPATPDIGLITRAQLTGGTFLSRGADKHEAILSDTYAQRKSLALGSSFNLNGTSFKVVGLAKPPLVGQAADVYLPLSELQNLSSRANRVNMIMVRAKSAADVDRLTKEIAAAFPGAQVTSSKDLAKQVTGSLTDTAKFARQFGIALGVAVLAAAFLMASLLTLSSVGKRVRELGTLRALGWRKGLLVRQVVAESLLQGAIGGLLGVALGIGAAFAVAAFAPPLEATVPPQVAATPYFFGRGAIATGPEDFVAKAATVARVPFEAPINLRIVLLAVGLAMLGGLVAGAAGALRTGRLRPASALRELG
jgi:ABC-type antimicrobial peptide transport system permease subunit